LEQFLNLIIPAFLVCCFLRLCVMPLKLGWKIGVNTVSGFACLWLLNLISGFTGLLFPINAVTALIAGFLGLPGIAVVGFLQWIL
jgi:inhibitor of the pro-sigma K processing machinery